MARANYFILISILLFFTASINQAIAQNVTMHSNGNGNHDFISTFPDKDLHFYLFDDGYHSFETTPSHQYHIDNVPAHVSLFQVGPYENDDPHERSAGTPYDGTANPSIPLYQFENKIEVKKSWNLVPDKEHYYILMFENNSNEPSFSGCIEFHFNTKQISVLQHSILDQYNAWVSNRAFESSEYANEGYHKKYKWQFSGLATGEQRFIYIPVECLSPTMDHVSVRGVIKYDCTQEILYNASEDGSLKHVNDSNFFTLKEKVRGYPHDPNAIVTDPYALSTYDEEQTVLYTVFFHNEGTAPAKDVTLDFSFDKHIIDVSFVGSSEPCSFSPVYSPSGVKDIDIIFPSIYLPGMAQLPSATYYSTIGWVSFLVCLDPIPWSQDHLSSAVDIYFDSLPAIQATTTQYQLINNSMNSNCGVNNSIQRNQVVFNQFLSDTVKIYPNPTRNQITLELPAANETNYRVKLYSLTGKLLWQNDFHESKNQIDLGPFNSGIYSLIVLDEQGNILRLPIVKH